MVRRYGAGVVVMAFDEQGQADHGRPQGGDLRARVPPAGGRGGFKPEDIVFDPNILTVATGMEEHYDFAGEFIDAVPRIKERCPGAKISGGVSNLSFSFRGNEVVREAIHSVFLYHAIQAGLDMGIVNAGQLAVYEDIPPDLLEHVDDIVFNRRPDATERMVTFAGTVKGEGTKRESVSEVLENLRSDLANRYLADPELAISQIAWLLGYQDVGAFSHAFKRWTGQTPGQARSEHTH